MRNVGRTAPRPAPTRWDIASAGLIAEQRRPDLLLELARRRPDLRFVITGGGRLEQAVRREAARMPHVDYLGFVEDVDAVLAASAVIVYGEDPATPYSPLACPNTLYQAIRLRRPLVFFCGGEPAEAVARFRIGVRCAADVEALSAAVDAARAGDGWEFDAAWRAYGVGAERAFQDRLRAIVPALG
jgi:glycosyltransferase involved in cell wall biosynthesis